MIDKVFLISDLHNAKAISTLTVANDVEVVVIAGDLVHPKIVFEHFSRFKLPVIVVAGNHDFWDKDINEGTDNLKRLAEQYSDIHVLDGECIVINGTRFIGSTLWTNYGDWHPRLVLESQAYLADNWKIAAKTWWSKPNNQQYARMLLQQLITDARKHNQIQYSLYEVDEWMSRLIEAGKFHPVIAHQLHLQSINFIKEQLAVQFEGKTVVVSHHPPTWEAIRTKYLNGKEINPDNWNHQRFFPGGDRFDMGPLDPEIAGGYGSPDEELFIKLGQYQHRLDPLHFEGKGGLVGTDIWLHGHIHDNFEYALHGTRFVVNALKSHRYKPEKSIVTISDGLRQTFTDTVRRTTDKIDEAIVELSQWTQCNEIESIQSNQVKNAVLSKLADSYKYAITALREFELEFERITGISRRSTDYVKMFNLELNVFRFNPIFVKYTDEFPIDRTNTLTTEYMSEVISDLKQEKEYISSYGWKCLPRNWPYIKKKLKQRRQDIPSEFIERKLSQGTVLYDFKISQINGTAMICGFDANDSYVIKPTPISSYDEVTGIGQLKSGGVFRTIGFNDTHVT